MTADHPLANNERMILLRINLDLLLLLSFIIIMRNKSEFYMLLRH